MRMRFKPYARPELLATDWHAHEPLVVMTDGDRSRLANVPGFPPTFHEWDGGCNNPEMVPIDENSVMLFYSDFYYPDADGVKRKTILCRRISVVD